MRRALLLLPLLAIAAGCEKKPAQGAVKVTVSYSGFLPGCIRIIARDQTSGGELAGEVAGKGTRAAGGSVVVAVLPPDNWGTDVQVEARAFEKSCKAPDTPVVTLTTTVALVRGQPVDAALQLSAKDQDQDGYVERPAGRDCRDDNAAINPEAAELCNNVDDNCDSILDPAHFQLGQSCRQADQVCEGRRQCAADGTVSCGDFIVPTYAHPDADGDAHGDRNVAAQPFCEPVPSTHVTGPIDDCDDSQPSVYTGAQERCDDLDNDCDGGRDEGFTGLGNMCNTPLTLCQGTVRCTADGSGTACISALTPTTWYRDEDGDGRGRNDMTQTSCPQPAGYVNAGGDCNESNPFIRPGATEVCDGLDNDCDGTVDGVGSCPTPNGMGTWADRSAGPANQIWHSVSTWTRGGVWAVGGNNHRAVLLPNGTGFTVSNSAANSCGDSGTGWYTVWADPQNNGRAYFGSAGGRLAYQDTNQTTCTQATVLNGLTVYSLMGIQNGGPLEFFGATTNTTPEEGTAIYANTLSSVTYSAANNDLAFTTDVHGRSRNNVFVVGGYDGTTPSAASPRIYRFDPNDTQGTPNDRWESMLPANTPGNQLKGVWVAADDVAFAVGNAGTVFRWDGTTWSRLPFPHSDAFLTSVVAFNRYTAYATADVSGTGRVYRYNGQGWQVVLEQANIRFNDIAGTGPDDLWVVGNNSRIYHWPQ